MPAHLRLLSTDFDGTLVAHHSDPVLDANCMQLIGDLQKDGTIWAVNTGRSMHLLESGLTDFEFPVRPDFILTSERDVFRPAGNGTKWEAYGDWNTRVAQDHAELYASASKVFAEIIDYVNQNTQARVIHETYGPEGLVAESEEELKRIISFIDEARAEHPKFHYQHNTVFLRFCHVDYHKGAALAELSRLIKIPREEIFAAGDHFNDISMLDGQYAAFPACPSNAIPEVKETVRDADGYVAKGACGAGVYQALRHFTQ